MGNCVVAKHSRKNYPKIMVLTDQGLERARRLNPTYMAFVPVKVEIDTYWIPEVVCRMGSRAIQDWIHLFGTYYVPDATRKEFSPL